MLALADRAPDARPLVDAERAHLLGRVLELATDADFPLVSARGGAVQANAEILREQVLASRDHQAAQAG